MASGSMGKKAAGKLSPVEISKLTREQMLKEMGWKPFKMGPTVPKAVVEAENRRMQDYILGWAQGMAAHIAKVDAAAAKGRKQAQPKRAKAPNKEKSR